MQSSEQAFEAWGSYDQDDPYPLFAEVRERGALHEVTLVDGHDAWLVTRHDEAKALLNDPRLSKDLQAALASSEGIVAEGLPGPDFARHMLVVDPPDHTRLRRLVSRRSPCAGSRLRGSPSAHTSATSNAGPPTCSPNASSIF